MRFAKKKLLNDSSGSSQNILSALVESDFYTLGADMGGEKFEIAVSCCTYMFAFLSDTLMTNCWRDCAVKISFYKRVYNFQLIKNFSLLRKSFVR